MGFSAANMAMAREGIEAKATPPLATVAAAVDAEALLPIPEPNLDRVEEAVSAHLERAYADLVELKNDPNVTKWGLGEAFGELGRVYHAHRLYDAAEPCYRNARALLTKDTRWPYLLGYLYQQQAMFQDAAQNYRRTLTLYPNYAPAQLRLAQVLLGAGQFHEVEPLLDGVLEAPEFRAAAAFQLGKAALAAGQYAQAVEWLTLAGNEQPDASRVHYPLAMAYRGLGNVEAARHHLAQRGEREPAIPDPVVEELDELLTGVRTRQYHAMRAIWRHRFDEAAAEFREILVHDPANIPARVSLGRCLYLLNDLDGAKQELGLALEQAPDHDKANYFLGRLLREQGQEEDAMAHFRAALGTNPEHAGARFFLADGLMRRGDFEPAARHFGEVAQALPEDLTTRQREAMALIATGAQAHGKALARISEALLIHPGDGVLTQQLARLLAASPNADARDGARALALAMDLFERQGSIENAELVAMAHAELGRFDEAAAYQQAAIDALAGYGYQYGGVALFERLGTNLAGYLARQPHRLLPAP